MLIPQRSFFRGHFPNEMPLAGVPFLPLATSRKTDDTGFRFPGSGCSPGGPLS